MKKIYFFMAMLIIVSPSWGQTQLAAWTFDATVGSPSTPTSVAANLGTQSGTATLYADGTNGSSAWIQASELDAFAGTPTNDPRGTTIAGNSYSPKNSSANGKTMVLKFSMTGYENPILTFATRGTSTGFGTHQWAWSTDNSTYTDFGTNTAQTTSTWVTRTLDMTSIDGLDGATTVYLRITFDGASSTSGNNRLDNIVINATSTVSCSGAPSAQATIASVGSPSYNSADITLVAGTGGTGRVLKINTTNSFTDLADGDDPTANTVYGGGEQVVYNGTGTGPVTVTGLTASTQYYLAVYEYNCASGRYYYNSGADPGTDNFFTSAPPALGLQLTAADTEYKIDFDNTVANVNEGQYDGSGFSTTPSTGQLNSNAWASTGMSDGDADFGTEHTTGDFARGQSSGGVGTGGFYAFTVSTGNNAMGVQPGSNDFNPGTITLKAQNKTGGTINTLNISYDLFVFNDQDRSSEIAFAYSTDNVTYTQINSDITPATADGSPEWKRTVYTLNIPGLSLAGNDFIYLRWTSDDYSGSSGSRDEFAIDNIALIANPSTQKLGLSGTYDNVYITAPTELNGPCFVNETVTLQSDDNLVLGNFDLTANSSYRVGNGYIQTNGSGSLILTNIGSSAKDFEVGNATYNPVSITDGGNQDWSVRIEDVIDNVAAPYNTNVAVNRTWHVEPSVIVAGLGGSAPTVTFTFDDSDPNQLVSKTDYDNATERKVDIWHYNGSYWHIAKSNIDLTPTNGSQTVMLDNFTSFSPFAISKTSGPLPVTLLNFSGHRVGAVNQLSWATTTELNNQGFEVQRSADGAHFTTIGFVNSIALNGNSSDRLDYTFTDAALTGVKQYYRLRQVDLNNAGKLSQIILINGDRPGVTKIDGVFPNPARNLLNIIVAASQNETLTMQVTDISGRTLQQQVITVGEGSNTVPVNVDKLSSGNYVIRIVTASGAVASQKFIKL